MFELLTDNWGVGADSGLLVHAWLSENHIVFVGVLLK